MMSLPKKQPARLNSNQCTELRRAVLRRDHWRCQHCGATDQLEVHHQQFRSHSGEDELDNLITLCRECHQGLHLKRTITNEDERSPILPSTTFDDTSD
jgi:5-methylcytosine-specific restriction endonuclease McrA